MSKKELLFARYHASHQHPFNRACHLIGIPLIMVALPVSMISFKTAATMFGAGWLLQFAGHWAERKPPAFLANPVYLGVGPLYFAQAAWGRLNGGRSMGRDGVH